MTTHTTSETGKALLQDIDKLKRNAAQVVQDVREHAGAHVDETRQRVNDTLDCVRESALGHPLSLLGIGFAVGLLVGWRIRS